MIIILIILTIIIVVNILMIFLEGEEDLIFSTLIFIILFFVTLCFYTKKETIEIITIKPFRDSISTIIKYKDEILVDKDHNIYMLDSIKLKYISDYNIFGGNIQNEIKIIK